MELVAVIVQRIVNKHVIMHTELSLYGKIVIILQNKCKILLNETGRQICNAQCIMHY